MYVISHDFWKLYVLQQLPRVIVILKPTKIQLCIMECNNNVISFSINN